MYSSMIRSIIKGRQLSVRPSFHRQLSLVVSDEVKRALASNQPVVSLESTIITHGLPYPQNYEMAQTVEQVVRDNGGIPATCAFIKGVPHVGLDQLQLQHLAEQSRDAVNKVSRRDIGFTMANKQDGGTTIALTMILSKLAGISVFATGGLGGVHMDGQDTMDVSADLTELGRTPVSVVCAGPKSILDIGRTMEYLETQGVFVGTYNDDGRNKVGVPGFYCRDSGVESPYSFTDFRQAAQIIHDQNNVMGLSSGNLFCIPPPVESALSLDFISEIIANANKEAKELGIKGKKLTPFLLAKIAEDTNGRSVECNIKFVLNNAKAATQIAKHLQLLRIQPSTRLSKSSKVPPKVEEVKSEKSIELSDSALSALSVDPVVSTVIIGSLALDTMATFKNKPVPSDSNPGAAKASIGGVGYNVSLAHKHGLKSHNSQETSRLISAVGDDFAGHTLLQKLSETDTSGINVAKGASTAQYISMHNPDGELFAACADMDIIEQDFVADHIKSELARAQPNQIVIDCNVSASTLDRALEYAKEELDATVIVEPTSAPKAKRISQVNSKRLLVYPSNTILMVTPTISELNSIFSSFSSRELFDDYDNWFPVLDSLGINSQFRDRLEILAAKNPILRKLIEEGVLQQAFQLLPYIPNILVKLGKDGLFLISINKNVSDFNSIPTTSKYAPSIMVTSQGRKYQEENESKVFGAVLQYFPIPEQNKNLNIINVTGAGDSLVGYLTSCGLTWRQEIELIEQEWAKWEGLHKAQIASGLSLTCESAISDDIARIKV